jgi:urocanate hydratase
MMNWWAISRKGLSVAEAKVLRETNPEDYCKRSLDTMAKHVRQMLELQKRGAITFDYGNNLRGQAKDKRGVMNAFDFRALCPPTFVRCFARAKDLFALWPSVATRTT